RFSRDWISDVCSSDLGESNESTTNESASENSEMSVNAEEEEEEASVDSGFVEVNETYNVNGLDIMIENIEITDDKVRVAMTIARSEERRVGKEVKAKD